MEPILDLPQLYKQLSPKQRRQVRAAYAEKQKGLCWHCQSPLSGDPAPEVMSKSLDMRRFPKDFLKWPVHLHHSHKTGLTIGAVHAKCNGVLFQYHGQ
jgi:hypothetical protein